ncbi:MAG: Ribose-5-phosphate isomerase B [Syntrophaceae bacterium PtaB.Bin095]|nr:MAG: Ribose-5-phosphate isomerase B [Syntrophaceae bacterium PtaB.Bin095]
MSGDGIIIGADHAGFHLKEAIKAHLTRRGLAVTDVGTAGPDPVDYPLHGAEAAARVSSGEFARCILICGSGIGMAIVANKFPDVRAAVCLDEDTARLGRLHNDLNVLCLAARKTEPARAEKIVDTWLETAFEGGRHLRRIERIRDIEARICRPQR